MRPSAPRRLVVTVERAQAGSTLDAFVGRQLAAAGIDEPAVEALSRGAVFVDGRRTTEADRRLRAGQTVKITTRTAVPELVVLAEDEDLIVLVKPAGISSTPDLSDRAGSLLGLAERRYGAGLHLLGRLDREVTGVVVALRTERARAAAAVLRREGRIERVYRALVHPTPSWVERRVELPLGRHPRNPRLRAPNGAQPQPACTDLRVVSALAAGVALVEARPATGRTHQIRVHLAEEGHPIVGDRAYGGSRRIVLPDGQVRAADRVMLHAARLSMPHPGGRGLLQAEAPLPADFEALVSLLSSRS